MTEKQKMTEQLIELTDAELDLVTGGSNKQGPGYGTGQPGNDKGNGAGQNDVSGHGHY